jgi:hypothetical protein
MVDATMEEKGLGERKKLVEQPWYVRFNIHGIVIASVFFLFIVVGFMQPYEPFKLYGWENVPEQVCPLQQFDSTYVSEVTPGPYTVGVLDGAATIMNEKGEVVDTWDIDDKNMDAHEKSEQASFVVRTAPTKPGEYHFGLTGNLTGRMFYVVPTYQEINYTADETIQVLPFDDKQCKDKF